MDVGTRWARWGFEKLLISWELNKWKPLGFTQNGTTNWVSDSFVGRNALLIRVGQERFSNTYNHALQPWWAKKNIQYNSWWLHQRTEFWSCIGHETNQPNWAVLIIWKLYNIKVCLMLWCHINNYYNYYVLSVTGAGMKWRFIMRFVLIKTLAKNISTNFTSKLPDESYLTFTHFSQINF